MVGPSFVNCVPFGNCQAVEFESRPSGGLRHSISFTFTFAWNTQHYRRMATRNRDQLRSTFALFDKDKDGEISSEELAKVMRIHGFDGSTAEVLHLISKVDKDGNGMIGYGEFLEMVLRQVREERGRY